jgi:hypothetical protein
MAHMTLPPEHSEADALLAERIGRELDLEEVHVFWTLPGEEGSTAAAGGPPDGEPANGLPGLLGALVALGALFERIGERIISPRR